MKIIAYYLPQFHEIPENNEWWGEGFTEWTNVKKAAPQYEGHMQPRVPLGRKYYDLTNDETKIWQANLAKKYGVFGFAYYHYWFNGHLLLEKPMEQMLNNKEIDIPFCISWANEPWTKAWVGNERITLIAQAYGGEKEWEEHFYYLLPFFKDDRYIKEDNKPLFIFYRPEFIPCLGEMCECWDRLAEKNGFGGIKFASQSNDFNQENAISNSCIDYFIEMQPDNAQSALRRKKTRKLNWLRKIRRKVTYFLGKKFGIDFYRYGGSFISKAMKTNRVDYDEIWNQILNTEPKSSKNIPGAYVGWDNTPRYGSRATIHIGDTPDKFKQYMTEQIKRTKDVYNKEFLFLYAWNEWAEGGYLEPDERYKYRNLEALKDALVENNEFPW